VGAVASPAVGDWFGLRGVRVTRQQTPVTGPPLGSALDLGRRVTLAELSVTDMRLRIPVALGGPDELWLDRAAGGAVVTLLYRPHAGLPEVGVSGVGALLSQLEGSLGGQGVIGKLAGPDTRIESVLVGGHRGLWLEGAHGVAVLDASGQLVPQTLRIADRVLLWEDGDVTVRLESALDRDAAIALAESSLVEGTG
jgi:hypothetical protein